LLIVLSAQCYELLKLATEELLISRRIDNGHAGGYRWNDTQPLSS